MCERIPYLILPVRQSSHEPLGKPPGPSRAETIYASHRARCRACLKPSAEAIRASRRASRRARLDPERYTQAAEACVKPTVIAACRASHWSKSPSARAGGRLQYRTEPLRLFAVNPLTVGELGRIVMGGVIPV